MAESERSVEMWQLFTRGDCRWGSGYLPGSILWFHYIRTKDGHSVILKCDIIQSFIFTVYWLFVFFPKEWIDVLQSANVRMELAIYSDRSGSYGRRSSFTFRRVKRKWPIRFRWWLWLLITSVSVITWSSAPNIYPTRRKSSDIGYLPPLCPFIIWLYSLVFSFVIRFGWCRSILADR